MPKDIPQLHITSIKKTLARVANYAWPDDVRAALQDADQRLAQLNEHLTANAEQGRLAALGKLSLSMGASLDLNEVPTHVMDAAIQLTHAERGFLMLIDPESGELRPYAARNIERETLERKDTEFSRTVTQSVIESGNGLVTTDAQNDPRFAAQASVMLYNLRSVMCAPLRARGQVVGVIYVDNRAQSGIFTEEDLSLLNVFASQAATAIENARLYTQTDQALAARVAELETLTQIDRNLNAQLDVNRAIDLARQAAIKETQATEGWILLTEEDAGGETHLHLAAGPKESFTLDLEDRAVDQCLKEVSPQVLPAKENAPARLLAAMLHSGKPVGLIVVERPDSFPRPAIAFIDRLSSRAASAIQNARLYQAVQDANQAKTKFVSVVTHELRLPMTSIKGYTDLLRQGAVGPVNEMQVNFLNVVRNNVDRMSVLVSDLSDISRIESGRLNLAVGMVSVSDCITETVSSLQPRIEEKKQTLVLNVAENLPRAYADQTRVVQILINLVSNASKYTPEEGRIAIEAAVVGERIRVAVADTGIGIAPEDQVQLFGQFFRSEDPAVREQQGWGLGLSVTRHLVELMGGEIGFTSIFREGSTFWFTLPTTATPVEA